MSPRRRRSRNRDRSEGGAVDDVRAAPSTPARVPRPTASARSGRVIVVADPYWVQPADLTPCEVAGCRGTVPPEVWELVDLDTGEPLPGAFCDEHALAWLTRPRPVQAAEPSPVG